MRIGAIIQARVSSTRLPGKVLKELPYGSGITVLGQVVRRLKKCKMLSYVIVATTVEKEDDRLVDIAQKEGAKHFRGSRDDVLSRYYSASKENHLDVIVRISSDCPCIDPGVVDMVIEKHIAARADYTSNSLVKTFPHGLDTEVLNFDTLEKAHFEATQTFEREHVCPYIYKSNPKAFKISEVQATEELYGPDIRLTLDTKEDYALLCAVFDYLYGENEFFSTTEIIKLFRAKPWLKMINNNTVQKKIFDTLEQEIEEGIRILDFNDLKKASSFFMTHFTTSSRL
jgi:spore coat polysaccharide biosynthesis protein SpsF